MSEKLGEIGQDTAPKSFETVLRAERKFLGILDQDDTTALCLSGGGIRSATFALGVLQGLAKQDLLQQFDYLSTVSGGGYIGGWLTAWRKNRGLANVMLGLKTPDSPAGRHLRQYSNYLSPKMGLFSADTWTLLTIFIRNLFLNFLILLPLLAAGVSAVLLWAAMLDSSRSVPRWMLQGLGVLTGGLIVVAVAHAGMWLPALGKTKLPNEKGSVSRALGSERQFLFWQVAPTVLAAMLGCLTWYGAASRVHPIDYGLATAMGIGAGIQVIGWGLAARHAESPNRMGWVTIVLFGAGGGAMIWGISHSAIHTFLVADPKRYQLLAVPLTLVAVSLLEFLFSGVGSWHETIKDQDREWLARASAWMLIAAAVWLVGNALVLYGPALLLLPQTYWRVSIAKGLGGTLFSGGLSGALATYLGWSPLTSSTGEKDAKAAKRWRSWLATHGAEKLLAPLFIVAIVGGMSLGTGAVMQGAQSLVSAIALFSIVPETVSPAFALGTLLAFLTLGCCASWVFSVNRFSLNAMYRNRLIRAYLGASRADRNPDPLTGFDPSDNVLMKEIYSADLTRTVAERRPFHILNLALNVTDGSELAWQQRQARPFTISPMFAGFGGANEPAAYQRSADYTDAGGISLGTAISVSGAAASPNMGYHSSKILTMLMALFNARLGAWLPNPSRQETLASGGPSSPVVMLKEMFGYTGADQPWVYLSDGGHFENLGLYEMVRRRVRYIVVSDASADPSYSLEDLTNALQKIRVDLGVSSWLIAAPEMHNQRGKKGSHAALIQLKYPPDGDAETVGWVLYLKPAFSGVEQVQSPDVYKYGCENAAFPHQSTSDQFFDETQFESYRRLGEQTIEQLVKGRTPKKVADLINLIHHDGYSSSEASAAALATMMRATSMQAED
jgi:Patatin-like phospholipase